MRSSRPRHGFRQTNGRIGALPLGAVRGCAPDEFTTTMMNIFCKIMTTGGPGFAILSRMKTKLCLLAFLLVTTLTPRLPAAPTATELLQTGLLEEEANRNLNAAIRAYQSVIDRFDGERKIAATAVFRLAECYRQQGKPDEARPLYERIIREFSDQSELARLSRRHVESREPKSIPSSIPSVTAIPSPPLLTPPYDEEDGLIRAFERMARNSPDLLNSPVDASKLAPLAEAARNGQARVMQFLITAGADVNRPDSQRLTALHHAASAGRKTAAEVLLDARAAVDARSASGQTPLHLAAGKGYISMVETLLARGAGIDALDVDGSTPLIYAARSGQKEMVELLLQRGAQINHQAEPHRSTALLAAVNSRQWSVAELLLAQGADVNAADVNGNTALLLCAGMPQNWADMMLFLRLLLPHQPDLERRAQGDTALHRTLRSGNTAFVRLLVEAGADVHARDGRDTAPLFLALRHPELVALLLSKGADPNTLDQSGYSALDCVSQPIPRSLYVRLTGSLLGNNAELPPLDAPESARLLRAAGAKSGAELKTSQPPAP